MLLGVTYIKLLTDGKAVLSSESTKMDLNKRFDDLFAKMNENSKELKDKMDTIDEKLTGISKKIETLDGKVKNIETKQTADDIRLTQIEKLLGEYKILINENTDSCKFTSDSYDKIKDLPNDVDAIKRENAQLKKANDDLNNKLKAEKIARNAGEQYHRTSLNIKLCGVPFQPLEEEPQTVSNPITLQVIKKVCEAASIIFDPSSVDVCHRLGESSANNPSPIIIRFKTKNMRFHFFNQKKKLQDLSSTDLDFSDITNDLVVESFKKAMNDRGRGCGRGRGRGRGRGGRGAGQDEGRRQTFAIYMQEDLTKYNKDLLKAAREKLGDSYKWAGYVKNGEIRARKEEGMDYDLITCFADIDKLVRE